eukprot:gene31046-7139_t
MHVKHRSLRVHVLSSDSGPDPSAKDLAWGTDLIITTFNRLSAEWESAAQAKSKSEDRGQLGPAPGQRKSKSSEASLFKQVHFLRVILDEGHML